jgi:hypothetical protein
LYRFIISYTLLFRLTTQVFSSKQCIPLIITYICLMFWIFDNLALCVVFFSALGLVCIAEKSIFHILFVAIVVPVVRNLVHWSNEPFLGKNDVTKRKTLADVLVRSDRHPKTWRVPVDKIMNPSGYFLLANASLLMHFGCISSIHMSRMLHSSYHICLT